MTGDPSAELGQDQFVGYPPQYDTQHSSTNLHDNIFNQTSVLDANNPILFDNGIFDDIFAPTSSRDPDTQGFLPANADNGSGLLGNYATSIKNEHQGPGSQYPPPPENGESYNVTTPYFSPQGRVDLQSDAWQQINESSHMVQKQPNSGNYAGDNMIAHEISSAYSAQQVDIHSQPFAQDTHGLGNMQILPEHCFNQDWTTEPYPYSSFHSHPRLYQSLQTGSYHPEQQEQSDITNSADYSEFLSVEHKSQTTSPAPGSSHVHLNAVPDFGSRACLKNRDAGRHFPPHCFSLSHNRPTQEISCSTSNVGSSLPPPLRPHTTNIEPPIDTAVSGEQVAELDDADTRKTRKAVTKKDIKEKGKNVNGPVNGKGKRKSALDINTSDVYKERVPEPQPWGNLTYSDNGQIEQYKLDSQTIRNYIEAKKPTIWVQNHPAQCGGRLALCASKCRWAECPAFRVETGLGTILAGWHRVAFDENEELTTGGRMNPFQVAMVMHLWCFEQCFDVMEFHNNKSLKPDTRVFPKEARNPMTLEREHVPHILKDAYNPWFDKHEPEAQINGIMKKPRDHEQSLCYALIDYHLEKEPKLRGKHRAKRNQNRKEELQKTINKHRGNLQLYIDLSEKAKQNEEAEESQNNEVASKDGLDTGDILNEMHQNESYGNSGSKQAPELVHIEPAICKEKSQCRKDSETRYSQEGVVPGVYLKHTAQGEASTAKIVPKMPAGCRASANDKQSSAKRKRGTSAEENQPRKIRRGKNESFATIGS